MGAGAGGGWDGSDHEGSWGGSDGDGAGGGGSDDDGCEDDDPPGVDNSSDEESDEDAAGGGGGGGGGSGSNDESSGDDDGGSGIDEGDVGGGGGDDDGGDGAGGGDGDDGTGPAEDDTSPDLTKEERRKWAALREQPLFPGSDMTVLQYCVVSLHEAEKHQTSAAALNGQLLGFRAAHAAHEHNIPPSIKAMRVVLGVEDHSKFVRCAPDARWCWQR